MIRALIALPFLVVPLQAQTTMEPIVRLEDDATGCQYMLYGSERGLEIFRSRPDCGVFVVDHKEQ